MEADLLRFYGVDYRDRWRRDEHGRPLLTLRRISVLVDNLPPESSLRMHLSKGEPVWRLEHVLLAHLWQVQARSKKPHPMLKRAMAKSRRGPSPRKLSDARRRAAARRAAIEAGRIT